MPKTTTKAVYKPNAMSTEEFIVLVQDVSAHQKWLGGDKTIPLVDIVDSFDVFHSAQGNQGLLVHPSKQELEAVFETTKDIDIVEKILTKGRIISSEAPLKFQSNTSGTSQHIKTSRGAVGGGR